MMTTQIRKCVAVALVAAGVCVACAQSLVREVTNIADAYTDRSREKREQEAAPDLIKKIFALAKQSAENDYNVNFSGFFTGMSRYDAVALAEYYKLKDGEYSVVAAPGKAVSRLEFSLKGVRRVTRGGNTLEELAQAVANRVGDLKHYKLKDLYEHKTIDGVVLTLDKDGLAIQNEGVALQKPLATAEAAQKDKADTDKSLEIVTGGVESLKGVSKEVVIQKIINEGVLGDADTDDSYYLTLMRDVHRHFIKHAKKFVFHDRRGNVLAIVMEVDDKSLTIQKVRYEKGKPVPDKETRVEWDRFYGLKEKVYLNYMNQFIIELVMKGRERTRIGPKEWRDRMIGAALMLQCLYSDKKGVDKFVPILVDMAAQDFVPPVK